MAEQVVIDSDVLSDVLSESFRGDPAVVTRARTYLAEYGQLDISIITQYEILRGLKAKQATRQLERFEEFCAQN